MAHRLTAAEAALARSLVQQGRSHRTVAEMLHVHHTTIGRVLRRFQETGSDDRRPGQGRPRVTNERDDRFLILSTLRDRFTTSTSMQELIRHVRNVQISSSTVRRRLHGAGIASRRPATGPRLTRQHRVARLAFARDHVNWTLEQWKRVLFTDETRVSLRGQDGRMQVWRRAGERYSQVCFSQREPFGGGSVMFWGGINFYARTAIVTVPRPALTADRYIVNILQDHVIPFAPFIGENFLLMQDNARPHNARAVTHYLRETGVNKLDWPPRSPDINPIEHLWDTLKRLIRARNPSPQTLHEVEQAVQEEWENIPQESIRNLIRGMRRRLQAVILARGGNTRY